MKKTFKTLALMLLTALAFSSCADVPEPYNLPGSESDSGNTPAATIEPAGEGTLASPYNVAAIVAKIKEMEAGVESTEEYYIKGKVTNVKTDEATIKQYGNHTFEMIDEGNSSVVFTAFQVYGPGKKKFTAVDDIKVGDEVVVCGKVVNFKGNTPETVGKGAAYVVSINSAGGGQGGDTPQGSIAVTCAEAVALVQAMEDGATSAETYTITGYITEVIGSVSRNQQTFWMADAMGGGRVFEAYYANLPEKVTEFKVNMKVTITGQLMKFINKTTSEVVPEIKNADVVILEDADSGQGGDTPGSDAEHISVAEFLQKADVNTVYELTGTVRNITNTTYGNFDLVDGDASIYIYGLLNLNGEKQKFASIGIEEGDIVTLTGKYKLYNNKPEIVDAQLVSFTKGDGGDTPEPPTPGPGGDEVTDLVNGGFESWVSESEPTGWKSASTASHAELSQSTDARTGSYACKVMAPGTANKRLATQEITLAAGSYTLSYYAKSTTADVCQTRGGYVPVNDDATVGAYQYDKTYTDLNSSSWTLVTYDFELAAATKLCLIIMNPKNSSYSVSQDILVDDVTLVKK